VTDREAIVVGNRTKDFITGEDEIFREFLGIRPDLEHLFPRTEVNKRLDKEEKEEEEWASNPNNHDGHY
jgi:hypothetical protein